MSLPRAASAFLRYDWTQGKRTMGTGYDSQAPENNRTMQKMSLCDSQ